MAFLFPVATCAFSIRVVKCVWCLILQKLILVETMNFLLLRSNQQAAPEPPPVQEEVAESTYVSSSATSLEGLIGEDPFPEYPTVENHDAETNGHLGENAGVGSDKKSSVPENHIDVCEEDGWITIPYSKCILTTLMIGFCSFSFLFLPSPYSFEKVKLVKVVLVLSV